MPATFGNSDFRSKRNSDVKDILNIFNLLKLKFGQSNEMKIRNSSYFKPMNECIAQGQPMNFVLFQFERF